MNQPQTCAHCTKQVYPMEELRCLDKTWHKACFKCHECGVVLNLQNYKGFQKVPYCRIHLPQLKPTQVASTPEIKRATQTTKLQSNVEYHSGFEKQRGHYTPVADTPEGRRAKVAGKLASNVEYHGEHLKKAEMEMKRSLGDDGIVKQNSSPGEDNRHAPTVIFTSSTGPIEPKAAGPDVHSIAEYDPVAEEKQAQSSLAGTVDVASSGFNSAQATTPTGKSVMEVFKEPGLKRSEVLLQSGLDEYVGTEDMDSVSDELDTAVDNLGSADPEMEQSEVVDVDANANYESSPGAGPEKKKTKKKDSPSEAQTPVA